jgi:outer membrane protein OmpA-like peptidoglycan-associated protein
MKLFKYLILGILLTNLAFAQKLVLSVTGTVIDEITKQPVSLVLEVFDSEGNKVNKSKSNAKDGYYFFTGFQPGKTYFVRNLSDINAPVKYFKQKFQINFPNTNKYEEYSMDLLLKPLAEGLEIPFKVIPFANNKSTLKNGFELSLKPTLEVLMENPRVKVEIVSYPDKKDNPENLSLTTERSKKLMEYFTNNGIKADRIQYSGKSDIDPKNPPPVGKASKGKKYKGSIYLIIRSN